MNKRELNLKNWFNLPNRTKQVIQKLIQKSDCIGIGEELIKIENKLSWYRTPELIKEIINIIRNAYVQPPETHNVWAKLPDDINKLELMVNSFDCSDFTAPPAFNFNVYTKERTSTSFTMGWDSVFRATDYQLQVIRPSTSPMMSGETQTIDIDNDVREYTVDNLNGNALYDNAAYLFVVIASNNSGSSNNRRYEGLPVAPRVVEKMIRIPTTKGVEGCSAFFNADTTYVYFNSDYVRTDIRKGHRLFKDANLTIPFTDTDYIVDELDSVLGDSSASMSDIKLDKNGVVQYVGELLYCN